MNLFKKIAAFTDIHLGLKSNSTVHNQDCEDFIDWYIAEAQAAGCETGIFMGDYHHNRNTMNLTTLDYSIRCLEKLGAAFENFYWFPGNHDLFFKDKRSIHSSMFGRHIPGITVINEVTTIDGVTMVPWLVGDEWKDIGKTKSKYMFGHFELPLFYMNAQVLMPDHNTIQTSQFKHQEYVFSGHFHKRQNQGKVWYIGNTFPHNFSDAGDDARGMMMLNWGGKPEFKAWPDAPKFRVVKLSELIDQADTIMKSKMYIKVHLDIDISFEEANFIKETFIKDYDIREISLVQDKANLDGETEPTDTKFESVTQIVSAELVNIESEQFDKKVLLDIFNNL